MLNNYLIIENSIYNNDFPAKLEVKRALSYLLKAR